MTDIYNSKHLTFKETKWWKSADLIFHHLLDLFSQIPMQTRQTSVKGYSADVVQLLLTPESHQRDSACILTDNKGEIPVP